MTHRRSPVAIVLAALALWAAPAAQAAFPGDNGKIAFDSGGDIYAIEPGGGTPVQLTATADSDFEPSWSPDGKRIVFARRAPSASEGEIWVMNADGGGQTRLTDAGAGANDSAPAFSGDGSRIVFARITVAQGFAAEIWVMNADGSGQTGLTTGESDSEPTFSFNNTRIAFVREYEGPSGFPDAVFTMAPDGTGQVPATPVDGSMSATGPNFSPDASRLAVSYCDFGPMDEGCPETFRIGTLPAGGGAVSAVTPSGSFGDPEDFSPAFSPDGTLIAFAREQSFGGASDVFTVAASGGAGAPLTATGDARNPDWQPLPRPATAAATGSCFGEKVTIAGTHGKDRIVGTPGDDVIRGFRGRDRITGKGGDDILCGGRGKDKLLGKAGDDVLIGGAHSDFLNGGPGRNRLFGGTPGAKPEKANNVCVVGPDDSERNCQTIK